MANQSFIALLLALFIGALDQTVVAATLPAIIQDLALPLNRLDDASWVITVYLAGYALILPIAGQAADRVSRLDRFVLGCLITFAVGSVIVGLGQSLATVIMGRFIQSLGAGALLPVALGRVRGEAALSSMVARIGWVTALAEGGAVLGPVYGAAALQLLSWRWIFLVNVPAVALICLWILWDRRLKDSPPASRAMDWMGGLLLGITLGAFTLGVSHEANKLLGGQGRAMVLLAGAGFAALFALQQRRASHPILPRAAVRDRRVTAVLAAHVLGGVALMAPLLLVPVWGNTLLGLSATQSALMLAQLTLTIPIGALLGSRLPARVPLSLVAAAGLLITAGALFVMGQWPREVTGEAMLPALLGCGFGFGLMIAPTNALAMAGAGASYAATVASLVQAARLVGMTLATAGLASFGLERFNALVADLSLADPDAYLQAVRASAHLVFSEMFRWSALSAALGALVVGLRARRRGSAMGAHNAP